MASPSQWETLRPQARRMRTRPTRTDHVLWQALRRETQGLKFRRQHAIGRFIVDFYCVKAQLVVEVDGQIHDHQQAADQERQAYLEGLGIQVLRVANNEVLTALPAVVDRIKEAVEARSVRDTKAPLSSQGEGMGER